MSCSIFLRISVFLTFRLIAWCQSDSGKPSLNCHLTDPVLQVAFGNVVWSYLSLKYLCVNSLTTCVLWDGRTPLCTAMQHQRHKLSSKVSRETIFDTRLHTRLRSQSHRGSVLNSCYLGSTTLTAKFSKHPFCVRALDVIEIQVLILVITQPVFHLSKSVDPRRTSLLFKINHANLKPCVIVHEQVCIAIMDRGRQVFAWTLKG